VLTIAIILGVMIILAAVLWAMDRWYRRYASAWPEGVGVKMPA
jgi:hypothetical protein